MRATSIIVKVKPKFYNVFLKFNFIFRFLGGKKGPKCVHFESKRYKNYVQLFITLLLK